MLTLVTGDEGLTKIQLTKEGSPFSINTSATVKVGIVTADHKELLSSVVTCLHTSPECDWSTSLISFSFLNAATQNIIITKPAMLELEVDDGGKLTWFIPIKLLKGQL